MTDQQTTALSFGKRVRGTLALLSVPIVALVVSMVALWLFRRYGLAFKPGHIDRVFAGKLTFLALGLAAFAVQYQWRGSLLP